MEGKAVPSISSPTLMKSLPRNYTVYTVSTLIQSNDHSQEFTVNRRFKDFEWLHNCLSSHCPGVLIPPLPKKDFWSRFDEDFIQSRIRGLEAFLHRILRHPLLHQQVYVLSFLQEHSMETSYSNFKSIQSQENPKRSESVAAWFESKFDSLAVSKQDILITSNVTVESEASILPIREYVEETKDKIHRVNTATQQLIQSYYVSRNLLEERYASMNSLSSFDDLQDSPLSPTALSAFTTTELTLINLLNNNLQQTTIEVVEPINRLTQTFVELTRTIEIQHESHEFYLTKLAILNKKQSEQKLKPNHEEDMTNSRQNYEKISENLKNEYKVYRMESSKELINSIQQLTNIQLDYHSKVESELLALQRSIEDSVIAGLPVSILPSAPILPQESFNYDPTVRTATGQPIGRVVSRKYIDTNENSAALLKESQYDENQDEVIIVGV